MSVLQVAARQRPASIALPVVLSPVSAPESSCCPPPRPETAAESNRSPSPKRRARAPWQASSLIESVAANYHRDARATLAPRRPAALRERPVETDLRRVPNPAATCPCGRLRNSPTGLICAQRKSLRAAQKPAGATRRSCPAANSRDFASALLIFGSPSRSSRAAGWRAANLVGNSAH